MSFKQIIKRIIMLFRQPFFYLKHNAISSSSWICSNCNLMYSKIGRNCYINRCTDINHVIMGNYCSIGPLVSIGGENHSVNYISTSDKLSEKGVANIITHIGHDVWIGTQACIKQGIKIGNGAVIGANSFVNKDVPPYSVVVGSPAKIIRYRFSEEIIKEIEESKYFLNPPQIAKIQIENIANKYSII